MFDDEEPYVFHTSTGRKIKLDKKGDGLIMEWIWWCRRRRRSDARVLGELGFTRQED